MKFSLTLPIILSAFYISFSLAQTALPPCVVACAEAAGVDAKCDPCVFLHLHLPRLYLTRPPHCRSTKACFCDNVLFVDDAAACVVASCSSADTQTAEAYWEGQCLQ